MRLGVLADTHIPDRTDELPAEILEVFGGVDLILHAGDVCRQAVLDQLQRVAPVQAVLGNRDRETLPYLPEKRIVPAGRWRIGMMHGTLPHLAQSGDRARYVRGDHRFVQVRRYVRQSFAGDGVQCIVFGHTHQVCEEMEDGVLLFNAGGVVASPGGGPSSVGILDVSEDGISAQVIVLMHPPRRRTFSEQMHLWLARRQAKQE